MAKKIPVGVRPKAYPELNGNEITLGTNSCIGHMSAYVWAKQKESPADGPDVKLQVELTNRLAEVLRTDPKLQEILTRMEANARQHKEWEAAQAKARKKA